MTPPLVVIASEGVRRLGIDAAMLTPMRRWSVLWPIAGRSSRRCSY